MIQGLLNEYKYLEQWKQIIMRDLGSYGCRIIYRKFEKNSAFSLTDRHSSNLFKQKLLLSKLLVTSKDRSETISPILHISM